MIHVETDPHVHSPGGESWWDVPVAEVSGLETSGAAYQEYLSHKGTQRSYLNPTPEHRLDEAVAVRKVEDR